MSDPLDAPSSRDAMPDDQLMLAYAGGDAFAFDLLYARHEGDMLRFLRRLMGVRLAAEVDEAFQETWGRIVAERAAFAPEDASWRVWAFTIAYRTGIERLRLSGREADFYAHDEDGDGLEAARLFGRGALRGGGADDHPSLEELNFWRAAGRRLLACLDELSDDQRAAFLLHHEDGFTVEVLAEALATEPETVRNRLRQGRAKLQTCMERYLSVLERHA